MHHATNPVKGFYAKTNKPARLNMFVGLAWRLPRLLSGRRGALCAALRPSAQTSSFECSSGGRGFSRAERNQESSLQSTTHCPLLTFNKQLSAFPAHATFPYLPCPGGGMADAEDLKSSGDFSSCGFDSHPGHNFLTTLPSISTLLLFAICQSVIYRLQ